MKFLKALFLTALLAVTFNLVQLNTAADAKLSCGIDAEFSRCPRPWPRPKDLGLDGLLSRHGDGSDTDTVPPKPIRPKNLRAEGKIIQLPNGDVVKTCKEDDKKRGGAASSGKIFWPKGVPPFVKDENCLGGRKKGGVAKIISLPKDPPLAKHIDPMRPWWPPKKVAVIILPMDPDQWPDVLPSLVSEVIPEDMLPTINGGAFPSINAKNS